MLRRAGIRRRLQGEAQVPVVRELLQVARHRVGEGIGIGERGIGARLLLGHERRYRRLGDLGKDVVLVEQARELRDHRMPLLRTDRRGTALGPRRRSQGGEEGEPQGDETNLEHGRLLS